MPGQLSEPADSLDQFTNICVRNILQRGPSVNREQRWPLMDVLLVELRRLLAPPSHRYMVRGLAVGLAAIAGSAMAAYHLEPIDRCTGDHAQMEGIRDDARRQAVKTAVLNTGVSYALGTTVALKIGNRASARAHAERAISILETDQ